MASVSEFFDSEIRAACVTTPIPPPISPVSSTSIRRFGCLVRTFDAAASALVKTGLSVFAGVKHNTSNPSLTAFSMDSAYMPTVGGLRWSSPDHM